MRWFLIGSVCFAVGCSNLFADNFDFSSGKLKNWQGQGFYVTTDNSRGPGHGFGVCSSDSASKNGMGLLRYHFTVPNGSGLIRFRAFANRPKKRADLGQMRIGLISGKTVVPLLKKTANGWQSVTTISPRTNGKAHEYAWDVSGLIGLSAEVRLIDADERPNCYLFSSGFRIFGVGSSSSQTANIAAKLRKAEKQFEGRKFVRKESTFFRTWSNADPQYTDTQVRNCEMLYRLFYDHFKKRGFTVRPLTQKMAMVVFHAPSDMSAFLGFRLPQSITGLYFRKGNYLLLYNVQHHEELVNHKQKALANSSQIPLDIQRTQYIQNVKNQVAQWTDDMAVSAAMHETAHQVSFNCGLLNRHGDVPLWLGEGLACYCEPTMKGSWQGIGRPNHSRIDALAQAGKTGKLMPLRTLLTSDDWRSSTQEAITGYAQSWALFRMLMQHRPKQLRTYMQLIYNRRSADHRLTDFCQVFGSDLNELEHDYRGYVQELVQQYGRRR